MLEAKLEHTHSMTTPLPVLWPSIMLLPSLSHCAFIPAVGSVVAVKKVFIQYSFLFVCVIAKA
jgi:hypothetical protein